jgi:hypothetical protein
MYKITMEANMKIKFLVLVLSVLVFQSQIHAERGIAAKYPNDIGIDEDRAVVFSEDFEDSTLQAVLDHWNDYVNDAGMALVGDVPPVSPGVQSLQMTSIIGQNTGGHLYKMLPEGYDTLHARFYVKFAPSCHPIHHFVHMGGYNPPTPWPQGGAGVKPVGDERFTTATEPMGSQWRWDFYTYWMHMRGNPGGPEYWGNTFNPTPPVPVPKDEWLCVELMVICNNPVTSFNGEQAFWVNGSLAHHLGEGFPNGYWIWDHFHPHPDSPPFEGYQWRIADTLEVNFFWLLYYITQGAPGQMDTVWFDDIVVATEYIGPVAVSEEIEEPKPQYGGLLSLPNPFTKMTDIRFQITEARQHLDIFDACGRLVKQFNYQTIGQSNKISWDGTDNKGENLPPGIYFCRAKTKDREFFTKIIKCR